MKIGDITHKIFDNNMKSINSYEDFHVNPGFAAVTKRCPCCMMKGKKTSETHIIPSEGYHRWKAGMFIQKALPELNECVREFLITGNCEDCRYEIDQIAERLEKDA